MPVTGGKHGQRKTSCGEICINQGQARVSGEKKGVGGVVGEGISRVKRPERSLGRKRATAA